MSVKKTEYLASSHVQSVLKTEAYMNRELTSIKVESVSSFPIQNITSTFTDMPKYPNVRVRVREKKDGEPRAIHEEEEAKYNQYIGAGEVCLLQTALRPGKPHKLSSFIRAGPRKEKVWSPQDVRAVIMTCGGLCPGLNDVISEIFHCLYWNYGVNEIYGIRNGYGGVYNAAIPWLKLTPELIKDAHTLGGTIIGSDRGGFDLDKIFQAFIDNGVNQVYVIGGDGTHRGADRLAAEALRRKLKMTVACVPKTIDNDIGIIDRSFGFDTAVGEAVKAIRSAVVEASCAPNGIGLVKLMGRDAGFISAHSTLASREVDLCLIPEVQFPMDGEDGVLATIEQALKYKGWAVVVVAEGAGEDLCKGSSSTDASGNKILPAVGDFLKKEIERYFKKRGVKVSIKYHDPSYMIRSVPANASDSVMCVVLAQNAVHGAMAGLTAFTSAMVNNRTVLLPISLVTASSPSHLNPKGRTWERVIGLTHQPVFKSRSGKGVEFVTGKAVPPAVQAVLEGGPIAKL
eukprot:gb/GEZN01004450.1/.p1 GENE.gb/GEZN01004450.1/~~gb/GEZN01004450.1/.p1  ORF type:complete len:514 (+),score=64.69 gb/GEZN01004450.1/:37-1578(+)